MADDKKTLLARKAVNLGKLSRFSLPPFPSLPPSFLKRFPELDQYNEETKRWHEQLNSSLERVLSTSQQ